MIKNYLYTIGSYLPNHLRQDILRDIEASLYEILEQLYGIKEYSNEELERVIIEFGHPKQVAENYLGESLTLISSDLYNEYFLALKVALFGGNIGLLISNFFNMDSSGISIKDVISIVGEHLQTSLSIFGLVTLIFIFVNRALIKEKVVRSTTWSIDSLKEFVEDKSKVSRFELSVESIFLIILSVGITSYFNVLINQFNQTIVILLSIFIISSLVLNLYLIIKGSWQNITRNLTLLLNAIFAFCLIFFYLNLSNLQLDVLSISGVLFSLRISIIIALLVIVYESFTQIRDLISR